MHPQSSNVGTGFSLLIVLLTADLAEFLTFSNAYLMQRHTASSGGSVLVARDACSRLFDATSAGTEIGLEHKIASCVPPSRRITINNPKKKKKRCLCPDPDELFEEDGTEEGEASIDSRREAMFAMMGSLWAMTATTTTAFTNPSPANAVAGTDAKMAFPDVLQGMADRNTKQCLVESLGNRECLVYQEDEEKLLYKGADAKVLLQRVQTASTALQTIPPLVETKQWSKITGVLTGPMGQLSATLGLLVGLAEEGARDKAKQKAQKVKQDLFSMGTATTNRQTAEILKYQKLATEDLAVFLKSL
jgi:hypothetical protein